MTGALVILAAMVIVGALLFLTDVAYFRHKHLPEAGANPQAPENPFTEKPHGDLCCGQHLVCEKNPLKILSDEIIYFDDEELDRFVGRSPESYSWEEIEEFRDVLLTLLPNEVAEWSKSITLRNINLPTEVRDELLIMLSEQPLENSLT